MSCQCADSLIHDPLGRRTVYVNICTPHGQSLPGLSSLDERNRSQDKADGGNQDSDQDGSEDEGQDSDEESLGHILDDERDDKSPAGHSRSRTSSHPLADVEINFGCLSDECTIDSGLSSDSQASADAMKTLYGLVWDFMSLLEVSCFGRLVALS